MYKVIYIVHMNDSEPEYFDTKEEALNFAEMHQSEVNSVEAVFLELNDFGEVIDELEHETLLSPEAEQPQEVTCTCSWCDEEWPESECRQEVNLGWLCPQCQQAIKSRGEHLIFIEGKEGGCCCSAEANSSVKPANNAVVDCEVNPVIAHSEDEKPLDCKMEKKPLEKPLVENVNINVSADRPEEIVNLIKSMISTDFDAFDQDFDAPVEEIPPVELDAGFTVDAPVESKEYVDPFEVNPFDDHPEDDEPEESQEVSEPSEIEIKDVTAEEADAEKISDKEESEDSAEPSEEEGDAEANDEEVELTDDEKEMKKKAESRPADEQPMDMIDGKLVPAKDPLESEVEVDDEESVDKELLESEDMRDEEFFMAFDEARKKLRENKLVEHDSIPQGLNFDKFWTTITYEDLGIPVEGEFGDQPYGSPCDPFEVVRFTDPYTLKGTLDVYKVPVASLPNSYERQVKVACEILGITPDQLTQKLIDSIDEKKFNYQQYDEFEKDAIKLATEYAEDGDWSDDEINWEEPDDYWEEPDYYWEEHDDGDVYESLEFTVDQDLADNRSAKKEKPEELAFDKKVNATEMRKHEAGIEDDLSDEEFLEEFNKVFEARRVKKVELTEEAQLAEAGLGTAISNKFKDLKANMTAKVGSDSPDKIFSNFYCIIYKVNGNKTKMAFDSFKKAEAWAQSATDRDKEINEVKLFAEKCKPEYEKIFKEVIDGFTLPVLLKVYRNGKVATDKLTQFNKDIKNMKRELKNKRELDQEDELEELTVKAEPVKKEVVSGEKINLAGLVLAGKYPDGEKVEVSNGYDFEPKVAPKELGKFTVAILYGGKIVDIELTAVDHEKSWAEKYLADKKAAKEKEALSKQEIPANKKTASKQSVNTQVKPTKGVNNAKIKKALETAGYDVNDLFTEDKDGNQKATDKLVNLRKELFGESLSEALEIPKDLNFDRFTDELAYDDLDLEVEGEFGGWPVPDGRPMWAPITYSPEYTATGILHNYTYSVNSCSDWYERLVALAAKMLNVKPQELTQEMIDSIDDDEFYEWQKEEFRSDAEEAAFTDWDYDDVEWPELVDYDEPEDY